MKTLLTVFMGVLLAGIFLLLIIPWGWGQLFDDDDPLRDRVTAVLENLDDDSSERQIRRELEDQVEDDDAEMLAEAISDALASGASIDDIVEAIEDLDDDINVRDISREIDGLRTVSAPPEDDDSASADDDSSSNGNGSTATSDQSSNGSACQPGDKVGTWSEGNNPHKIEVGGHGLQHLDFYPEVGVKAISYAVGNIDDPDGTPDLAWGFGSLWEWNPPGCDYDLVADLTDYARARLDSGHSGLVLQWGTWEVLENVGDLSQSQVENLVSSHQAALGDRKVASSSSSAQASQPADCEAEKQPDNTRPNGGDTVWNIGGDERSYIANVWNPAVNGGAEQKLFVSEGEEVTLTGYGGSLWAFSAGCQSAAEAEYSANSLPAFK